MDRRTYESPMDWEYQGNAPMDPSSPFVQSVRQTGQTGQGHSFSSSNFNSNRFGQNQSQDQPANPFSRTHSTPSKTGPSSFLQRTTTAPPFRNPSFITPRKPFDADFEASPAESSPAAATDVSMPDTPDPDHSIDAGQMTITPATMNRNRSLTGGKKTPGRGEILRSVFPGRDRVRKRRRQNGDQDLSGYRLPYRHQGEWDETDYESDESSGQPNRPQGNATHPKQQQKGQRGWISNFLGVIQNHPDAPQILSFWLTLTFNIVILGITFSVMWMVWSGLRADFFSARQKARNEILDEISRCVANFVENKCAPIEQRLPALRAKCEQWDECQNQDPDSIRNVQIGAKGIVEILNEIVEAMHWKTMVLLVVVLFLFFNSGRSLLRNTTGYTSYASQQPPPPTPYPSQAASHHMMHSAGDIAWEQIPHQTPRHLKPRQLFQANDETPESDASPPASSRYSRSIMPPETPSRRSPFKSDRGRSPAKSRSPTKRY